jgi:hypothetical protein
MMNMLGAPSARTPGTGALIGTIDAIRIDHMLRATSATGTDAAIGTIFGRPVGDAFGKKPTALLSGVG